MIIMCDVFLSMPHKSVRNKAYRMIPSAFKVAIRKNIIATNPAISAKEYVKKSKKMKMRSYTRNGTDHLPKKNLI